MTVPFRRIYHEISILDVFDCRENKMNMCKTVHDVCYGQSMHVHLDNEWTFLIDIPF